MVQRQFPKPVELLEHLSFKRPELDGRKRRLDAALTIEDLRTIAKRRTPKAAFDYTDGSAEGEVSIARARQAFEDVEFHPQVLRDVAAVDTTATVLGAPSALPFGIAPTGFTRLMQTEGETAGAGAAAAAGIPFTLSTLGTTSIEDVRDVNPVGAIANGMAIGPPRTVLDVSTFATSRSTDGLNSTSRNAVRARRSDSSPSAAPSV